MSRSFESYPPRNTNILVYPDKNNTITIIAVTPLTPIPTFLTDIAFIDSSVHDAGARASDNPPEGCRRGEEAGGGAEGAVLQETRPRPVRVMQKRAWDYVVFDCGWKQRISGGSAPGVVQETCPRPLCMMQRGHGNVASSVACCNKGWWSKCGRCPPRSLPAAFG